VTAAANDLEPVLDFDERAYHEFLRAAKLFWSRDLYGSLRLDFVRRGCDTLEVDAAEREMRKSPDYQFYAWFERNLQQMKYASPRGILAIVEHDRERLTAALDQARLRGEESGRLRLNPDLALPRYYTANDFHQHPGGVSRDDLAGVAYELGRRTTMPLQVDPFAMHDAVAVAMPEGPHCRILDLGCGTGRSTLALKRRFPDAQVHGIDLSGPCLMLAQALAEEEGLELFWSQQDAERTDFDIGSFDLIHSTFLLHEMPVKSIERVVEEASRLLRPGGWFAHLDFYSPPGGVWGRFIHYGHARRNNEVFMRSFCESAFVELQRHHGFTDVTIENFDDGTGPVGADDIPPVWRFPFQLLKARKV
jgi:SAM-dependent methyltransferase